MAVEAEDFAALGKELPQGHAFRSQVPDWFEERAHRKEMPDQAELAQQRDSPL